MNKKELIQAVASDSGMPQAAVEKALNSILGIIEKSMAKEESVTLIGFGTFSVKERAARKGHNPATKQMILIPAKKTVKFKPGKGLECTLKK